MKPIELHLTDEQRRKLKFLCTIYGKDKDNPLPARDLVGNMLIGAFDQVYRGIQDTYQRMNPEAAEHVGEDVLNAAVMLDEMKAVPGGNIHVAGDEGQETPEGTVQGDQPSGVEE